MIKRAEAMTKISKAEMRGGTGTVQIMNVLDAGEYEGKSRMMASITLEPGCSIGGHTHENEEEIFYVLEGSASYDDNGMPVLLHAGDSCICRSGECHALANASAQQTLRVFAVILTI